MIERGNILKVKFATNKIDKTLYRQIIYKYVAEHRDRGTDYVIEIHPTDSTKDFGMYLSNRNTVLNAGMPHGVTTRNSCKIYINDVEDYGLIVLQNAGVICHELAHLILITKYWNNKQRVPLRHDDKSGNKAGKLLNIWTSEVHDRETEGRMRYMTVYRKLLYKWIPITLRVLDIKDLV